ncbi:MAG: BRO family protein [Fusobacterium sp.]
MEKLEIVKFEEQDIQLYSQNDELVMSMEELGEATGFTNKNVFKDFLSRNPELLTEEFSFLRKVKNLEGGIVKNREKRFFNEQGIYEAALLARTEKAKKFRKFARVLITKYHRREMLPVSSEALMAKIKITDEKLDKIERILVDRQETFKKMSEDSEKEITLLEKLEQKIQILDSVDERLKAMEEKIGEIIECVNGIIDTMEEE